MLDYLDDIASDLSAFHRIDDPSTLDGPRYFRLAWRLAAYQGVMQARAAAEQQASEPQQRPFEYGAPSGDVNPGTQVTLKADPAFAGVFSFGSPSS
jgi:hypothetical protein